MKSILYLSLLPASIVSFSSSLTRVDMILFRVLQEKVHNQPALPAKISPVTVKIPRSMSPDEEKKQKAFIQNLYSFMKARLTPIGRLPHIGNRESNFT